MGTFETPQDSNEWAENKHLVRHCHKHNNYFDPNLGCKDCELESARVNPIQRVGFDPFRVVKPGYKLYADSYWAKIDFNDAPDIPGMKLTDSDGVWVQVSIEEATYLMEIKESPVKPEITEKIKILTQTLNDESLCPTCGKSTLKYGAIHSFQYYKCTNPECNTVFGLDELKKLRENSVIPPKTHNRTPIWAKLYPPEAK